MGVYIRKCACCPSLVLTHTRTATTMLAVSSLCFVLTASLCCITSALPSAWNGTLAGPLKKQASHNLGDTLAEFDALIPYDDLINVLVKYRKDPEVKEALKYLNSEEFSQIVTSLDYTKEFYDFMDYLEVNGVNVYDIVNEFREMLDIPPLATICFLTGAARSATGRSLNGMLDDMVAVLPTQQFSALFEEKLAHDSYFQALIERMRGADFQVIVDTVYNLPQFQSMLQKLRDRKVDVDTVITELANFFGWHA